MKKVFKEILYILSFSCAFIFFAVLLILLKVDIQNGYNNINSIVIRLIGIFGWVYIAYTLFKYGKKCINKIR